jgi:hypothetical protein
MTILFVLKISEVAMFFHCISVVSCVAVFEMATGQNA